ncbi:hypothetical protein PSPO01_08569, partial [Paraphaeosphaeria sporulosa]
AQFDDKLRETFCRSAGAGHCAQEQSSGLHPAPLLAFPVAARVVRRCGATEEDAGERLRAHGQWVVRADPGMACNTTAGLLQSAQGRLLEPSSCWTEARLQLCCAHCNASQSGRRKREDRRERWSVDVEEEAHGRRIAGRGPISRGSGTHCEACAAVSARSLSTLSARYELKTRARRLAASTNGPPSRATSARGRRGIVLLTSGKPSEKTTNASRLHPTSPRAQNNARAVWNAMPDVVRGQNYLIGLARCFSRITSLSQLLCWTDKVNALDADTGPCRLVSIRISSAGSPKHGRYKPEYTSIHLIPRAPSATPVQKQEGPPTATAT